MIKNYLSKFKKTNYNLFYRMSSTYSIIPNFTYPSKQKAIFFTENGGPEVLKYDFIDTPKVDDLKPNELIVKIKYIGVNLIETYFRKGIYKTSFPYVLGREASGQVVVKGEDVSDIELNDNLVFLKNATFSQYVKLSVQQDKYINVGKDCSDDSLKQYTASLLQGLTVLTFVNEAYKVKEGDYILNYAAAGGVGSIFNQVLKLKGAKVIATASTEEKLQLAKKYGADYTVLVSDPDFVSKVKSFTPDGRGCDAIYDSLGKDTFEKSFEIVRRKGSLISYGNATGTVEPLLINRLSAKNVKIARPQLFGYITEKEEFDHYSKELIKLIDEKKLCINIFKTYDLKEYPEATKLMEDRKTTGKLLLKAPE